MSGDTKNDGLPTLDEWFAIGRRKFEEAAKEPFNYLGVDTFQPEYYSHSIEAPQAGTPLLGEINNREQPSPWSELKDALLDAPGFYIECNEYGRFEVREKRDNSDTWHASFRRADIAEAWLVSWVMGQTKGSDDGREVQALPTGCGGY